MIEYVAKGAARARESQKVPVVAGVLTGVIAPCQDRVRPSMVHL